MEIFNDATVLWLPFFIAILVAIVIGLYFLSTWDNPEHRDYLRWTARSFVRSPWTYVWTGVTVLLCGIAPWAAFNWLPEDDAGITAAFLYLGAIMIVGTGAIWSMAQSVKKG